MKRKLLGTYPLGEDYVRVYTLSDRGGGNLKFSPPDKGTASMEIGLVKTSWSAILDVLLHETLEMLLIRMYRVFQPLCPQVDSTSNRFFMVDHEQFGELCAQAAPFLTWVQPDLCRAWRAAQKDCAQQQKQKRQRLSQKKKPKQKTP